MLHTSTKHPVKMSTSNQDEAPSSVEISKKLVLINSSSSLVALVLNATVLIWLQQFLLKRIDTEEYSVLPVVYSVMMFTPLLTTLFTRGLGRYSTEAYAAGDTGRVTQVASTMFAILLGVGSLFLATGLFLTYHLDSVLTIAPEYYRDAQIMFTLLIASFSLHVILAPFSVGLEIRQKYMITHIVQTSGQFLRITILFILLFGVSVKVVWVVLSTVSASFVTQLVILGLSMRIVPYLRFKRSSINFPIAKQLMSFGGWSTLTAFGIAIRTSADAIILNKLGTSFDVTCFYLGALPLRFITMAGNAASEPLRPALIAMHTTGQPERLGRAFLKGGRWALWFTLIATAPLMIFGPELVTLYIGVDYRQAGIVMILVLVMFPLGQGCRMMFPIADATANVRAISLSVLAMSLFNLILTIILVGVFDMGAIGSALGTAISLILLYPLLMWPLGMKIAKVDFTTSIKKILWPGLLPFAVSVGTLFGLKSMFTIDTWIELAGCIAIGGLLYVLVLFKMCLQSEDHEDLNKLTHALQNRPVIKKFLASFMGGKK